MADNFIARKNADWKVVYVLPDVCKTPMGGSTPPVPYPVTAELKDSLQFADRVQANGDPIVAFDASYVPKTIGDKPGKALGVKSGTVEGLCWPKEKSQSVRVQGKLIIRHDDEFWMNGA
jgi:uncharacterized protein DUF4150